MNMTITAFDDSGKQFDEDQQEKMNFQLEIERGILRSSGLKTKLIKGRNELYEVTGVEPGNYVVTAFIEKNRAKT
jgi:hypothetical protein